MEFKGQTITFESDALGAHTFVVEKIVGVEAMSLPFRFEVDVMAAESELELDEVLYAPARIGLKSRRREAAITGGFVTQTYVISGELECFEQLDEGTGWVRYRAVLVPRLDRLRGVFRSRVFQDLSGPEIVKQVLSEAELSEGDDFELSDSVSDGIGQDAHPTREYVVQYEESDLDFIHRWLEHEGVFYYFKNETSTSDKLILGSGTGDYTELRSEGQFAYRPQGTVDADEQGYDASIRSLRCQVSRLPKRVELNDYNWRAPDLDLKVVEEVVNDAVRSDGRSTHYEYNQHYKTSEQGQSLAKVRAQELSCRGQVFRGTTDARNLRPGTVFELTDHYRSDFNMSYLVLEVRHTGQQALALESQSVSSSSYEAAFVAVPADEVFRPECVTEWPAIKGVLHGQIDSDGRSDDGYAQIDDQGRYKVRLPFDLFGADAGEGKASRYIRLLQPYSGSNEGMHFPLRIGTEVMLTHVDGDPDRPVIAGTVTNPNTPSVVDSGNNTQNVIQTSSGNRMQFDDAEGGTGITLMNATGTAMVTYSQPGGMNNMNVPGSPGGGGGAFDRLQRTEASGAASPPAEAGTPEADAQAPLAETATGTEAEAPQEAGQALVAASSARSRDGLPGGGLGTEESIEDGTSGDTSGAGAFILFAEVTDDAEIKTGLNEVYEPGGSAVGASSVIATLNGVTSAFEGAVGKYEVVSNGPHVEVVVGDKGEYSKGARRLAHTEVSAEYREKIIPDSHEGADYKIVQGTSDKRFNNYDDHIFAKEVNIKVGEEGNRCHKITETSAAAIYHNFRYCRNSVEAILAQGAINEDFLALGSVSSSRVSIANVFEFDAAITVIEVTVGIYVDLKQPISIEHVWGSRMQFENFSGEFDISNLDCRVDQIEVALGKTDAAISDKDLDVIQNKATVQEQHAAVSGQFARLQNVCTALQDTSTALSQVETALNQNNAALSQANTALSNKTTALAVQLGLP